MRRASVFVAITLSTLLMHGCGKSKAVKEAEAAKAQATQRQLENTLQETKERLEAAEQRAATAENQAKAQAAQKASEDAAKNEEATAIAALKEKVASTAQGPELGSVPRRQADD